MVLVCYELAVYSREPVVVVGVERLYGVGVFTKAPPPQHVHVFALDQRVHALDEKLQAHIMFN